MHEAGGQSDQSDERRPVFPSCLSCLESNVEGENVFVTEGGTLYRAFDYAMEGLIRRERVETRHTYFLRVLYLCYIH